jgi:hypothetical protein
MSNWFKKISQEQNKARWSFSVEADVWVPEDMDEESEKQVAHKVLQTVLNQVEGDASLHTAIDSNVRFQIQFEPLKIR